MNKKEIENEILSILNERRNKAQFKAVEYYDEAYKKEEFVKADKQLRECKIDLAKSRFENKNVEKMQEKYENSLKNWQNLCKKLNFDEKRFDQNYYYTCKICKDSGFIKGEKCKCYKSIFNKLITKNRTTLPTMNDFDETLFDDAQVSKNVKNIMEKYINDFPAVPLSFILQGNVGVGKTFIVQAIMSEIIRQNYIVNYFTAFEFAKTLKDWHFASIEDKGSFEDIFMDCDLLILDDIGTEPIYKNINYEYIQNIIDQRLYKKLPTIIVTNLKSDEFVVQYGERLYSRLFFGNDSYSIKIENSDIRKKLHIKKIQQK